MRWKKLFAISVALTSVFVIMILLWRSSEVRAVFRSAKGFSSCAVQHLNQLDSSLMPCEEFNPPLPNTSQIIVTFINREWISLAQNWICSVSRLGLQSSIYLIAVGPNVCNNFLNTSCYQHPTLSLPGARYAQPAYQKFMIERTKLVLSLMQCTRSKILLSDSDVVFLRDPLPILNNELLDHDIVFQEDSTGVHLLDTVLTYAYSGICGGFIYLQPSRRTVDLFSSVLTYQLNWNWNDQSGLNICIRWHGRSIKWKTLEKRLFPNGKEFFEFHHSSRSDALIVHANFIRFVPDKISRMMERGLWCLEW